MAHSGQPKTGQGQEWRVAAAETGQGQERRAVAAETGQGQERRVAAADVTLGLSRNRSVGGFKGNQATFDNSQRNNLRSCVWVWVGSVGEAVRAGLPPVSERKPFSFMVEFVA